MSIDTVAVLRDKVITYVATNRHPWSPAETVDLLIAAVRHEHGERIAKAIVEMPHKCVAATYAADIARDLSPPP